LRGTVVRGGITKATATVTFLSDDGPGAFTGVEATAARSAIRIVGTGTSDELCAGGGWCGGSRCGGSSIVAGARIVVHTGCGFSIRPLNGLGGTIVGSRVTEAATAITFLSDDGASTFARVEAAASGGAVCVAAAGAGNELCAGRDTGHHRSGGNQSKVGNEEERQANHYEQVDVSINVSG